MENITKPALETPSAKAIRLIGAKRIAQRCDLCTDAVWKWPKRATGLIPARYQAAVLDLARELGLDLTAAEIIGVAA